MTATPSLESPTPMLEVEHAASVLTIRLARPEALNALRPEMLEGIASLVEAAGAREDVAVVVLEGKGRAFSAGVDLKVLQGIDPVAGKIGDVFDAPARRAYQAIRRSPLPVIAKVHGACFTGALEIALHCDFVLTTVDAKFGDTHGKWALTPVWGMSQRLPRRVGIATAKRLMFTCKMIDAAEALRIGLCEEVYPETSFATHLDELARSITANSVFSHRANKRLLEATDGQALDAGLLWEVMETEGVGPDMQERINAFTRK